MTAGRSAGIRHTDGAFSGTSGDYDSDNGIDSRAPFLRETSTMLVRGKRVSRNSDLTTIAIDGRITVARRNRPGCTKPEAKVERMETAAMRVYFMFRR